MCWPLTARTFTQLTNSIVLLASAMKMFLQMGKSPNGAEILSVVPRGNMIQKIKAAFGEIKRNSSVARVSRHKDDTRTVLSLTACGVHVTSVRFDREKYERLSTVSFCRLLSFTLVWIYRLSAPVALKCVAQAFLAALGWVEKTIDDSEHRNCCGSSMVASRKLGCDAWQEEFHWTLSIRRFANWSNFGGLQLKILQFLPVDACSSANRQIPTTPTCAQKGAVSASHQKKKNMFFQCSLSGTSWSQLSPVNMVAKQSHEWWTWIGSTKMFKTVRPCPRRESIFWGKSAFIGFSCNEKSQFSERSSKSNFARSERHAQLRWASVQVVSSSKLGCPCTTPKLSIFAAMIFLPLIIWSSIKLHRLGFLSMCVVALNIKTAVVMKQKFAAFSDMGKKWIRCDSRSGEC